MCPLIYVLMTFMFLIVVCGTYAVVKLVLGFICKKNHCRFNREHKYCNSRLEEIYKETMKDM